MKRLLVVVLVGVLALLAGCSDGDPEPKIAPTDSSSAASSPSPSPSASGPDEPSLPAEAEGEDAAAAEAFVRFYWEMVNYAQSTGDVDTLKSLADRSCAPCVAGYEGIEKTHELGGSIAGGEVSVSRASAHQISSQVGSSFAVDVRAGVSQQTVRQPGEEPVKYPGGPVRFQFIARVADGEWAVMRLDVVQ